MPAIDASNTNLFKPIQVGNVILKNRLVYSPTTRFRNSNDFVATDSMLEYYKARAENNGGLIITEATFPSYGFGIYNNAPMIKTTPQVKAWKEIVDSVHKAGSFISLQLWNLGSLADPKLLKEYGLPINGPSPVYVNESFEKAAKHAGNELKGMTIEEIKAMTKEYVECAERAINEAGFDFVEIHAAYMYLLDEFLQSLTNERTDAYGGNIENRARFLLEVVDAVTEAVGPERVGIKVYPYTAYEGVEKFHSKTDPIVTWGYVLSELERRAKDGRRLAYLSIVEPRISGSEDNPLGYKIDYSWVQSIWQGVILTAGAHLDKRNISNLPNVVNRDDRTLIGVSRYYTSNPDLANRLKHGYELTPYDRPNFYKPLTNVGYLNFQSYDKPEDHSKDAISPKPLA